MDHNAAQAAGIYTGFYHYAVLPDVTDPEDIKKDALAQAQKVVWRLASLGGYGEKDLPYALDLENKTNSGSVHFGKINLRIIGMLPSTYVGPMNSSTWSE